MVEIKRNKVIAAVKAHFDQLAYYCYFLLIVFSFSMRKKLF